MAQELMAVWSELNTNGQKMHLLADAVNAELPEGHEVKVVYVNQHFYMLVTTEETFRLHVVTLEKIRADWQTRRIPEK